MARRTRVTSWYARHSGHIAKGGSERSAAVGRTVRALTAVDTLPGPSDFEATRKPFGRAWVRRVTGRNLWLWYRFDDNEVMLVALTTDPPLPLDDQSE